MYQNPSDTSWYFYWRKVGHQFWMARVGWYWGANSNASEEAMEPLFLSFLDFVLSFYHLAINCIKGNLLEVGGQFEPIQTQLDSRWSLLKVCIVKFWPLNNLMHCMALIGPCEEAL